MTTKNFFSGFHIVFSVSFCRVSIESFKQGVLREQLANLATRQKSLLVVAKKQKKITQISKTIKTLHLVWS